MSEEHFRLDDYHTLSQVSEDFGIPYHTLRARVLSRGIDRIGYMGMWLVRIEDVPRINEATKPGRPRNSNKKDYHPLYHRWRGIKSRCLNPNHPSYSNYGGRGITLCDEWLTDFEQFVKDVGMPPEDRPVLDRRDNDLGYFKDNCRWVSWETSNLNRRNVTPENRR